MGDPKAAVFITLILCTKNYKFYTVMSKEICVGKYLFFVCD